MKLHVFSDLHDGFRGSWRPTLAPGADAVLCAGDVCEGLPEAVRLLRIWIPAPTPIVTVAGNHSFYGRVMSEQWTPGRAAAREHDVTLLENEAMVIGGVRFVGATLWTDYSHHGDHDQAAAMIRAEREVNDHRLILVSKKRRELFKPALALGLHRESIAALHRLLSVPFAGPTIVLTHHAPSPLSIAPRYRGNGLNPACCSDLGDLIRRYQPFAWIHGHMHSSADYRVGRTRVLNNPHGYGNENATGFDPALILDAEIRLDE